MHRSHCLEHPVQILQPQVNLLGPDVMTSLTHAVGIKSLALRFISCANGGIGDDPISFMATSEICVRMISSDFGIPPFVGSQLNMRLSMPTCLMQLSLCSCCNITDGWTF